MEDVLCLRFLGTVQVERAGERVRGFRSRKALALLGYLAVRGQPVPRERLADLFWDDSPEARGRANLSWVLNRISTLLPGCLQADRHSVHLCCPANYWLDTDAFLELEARGDADSLAAAVDLYRGEFLEGLDLEDCAEFELWLVGERERWRQRMAGVLEGLVAHHSQRGDYDQGLLLARRLLALEPWREETHRQVMRLLTWGGQRAAALAQYETCRCALAEELGVEPATETMRLYEQIRNEEVETRLSTPIRLPDFGVPLPPFLADEGSVEKPVFVARERELSRLAGFLDGMLDGQGQVVFVTGDAGQGKTALIREFVRHAQTAHLDLVVASGNGNAHVGIGDPYLPFREVLSLLAGDIEAQWTAGAMDREQARRLWHMLPLTAGALVDAGPDLVDTLVSGATLVGRVAAMEMMIPGQMSWLPRLKDLVERRATSPATPGSQQTNLFEQYTQVLKALARERPLLLVLDDLQWADPASLSLLFHLGRRIEGSRILIVGAYRPAEIRIGRSGKRHPLAPVVGEFKRRFSEIEVDLGQAQGRHFVEAFLDTLPNRLSAAFRETLYRQTGGNPLFTVELLRGMQERGDLVQDQEGHWLEGPALDWEMLPARVEAVIAERIGQLPQPLRQTLRVASVEGETFTAEVVARVAATGEQEIVDCLSKDLIRKYRLVRAQGLHRLGSKSLACYQFQHILFQKHLYNGLDPVERGRLHEAVGTALEALYAGQMEESLAIALQLAWHFQEAGYAEKAVEYFRQAGERAVRMSANEEAIAHFTQGLALLQTLPESLERDKAELMLRVGLSAPLQTVKGYEESGLDHLYARAWELCQKIGDAPHLLSVLGTLVIVYGNRGEHRAARKIAEEHVALAERVGDPASLAPAHYSLGWNMLFRGKFALSRVHLERAIAAVEPPQQHAQAYLYGYAPGVAARSTLSWVLWFLGYPEQAMQRAREALALAHELAHPFSLALAQSLVSLLYMLCRDVQAARELSEACIRFSTEQGFYYWLALGTFSHGWALVQQGQVQEGLTQMYESVADVHAVGAGGALGFVSTMLAEGYGKAGMPERGLACLTRAVETVQRNEEHWHEAEIYRLRGEWWWMQGDEGRAEASFERAIEVACQQNAKSLELRAVTSLCRLWQKRGKQEAARRRLVEIYGWFTEGFDTRDLQDAQALLVGQA
jgi:DNA-binding SARP family transcriptional activator/tetratricopeptide (TPR) repeat protein